MALFKRNNPIGKLEAELVRLRAERERLVTKSDKAAADLREADRLQREALGGDGEPALVKIASRRAVLVEIATAAEASLNDLGAKISETEAALTEAREKADREKRASGLEAKAAALSPLFDDYLAVADRFASALIGIEGVLTRSRRAAWFGKPPARSSWQKLISFPTFSLSRSKSATRHPRYPSRRCRRGLSPAHGG